MKKFITTLTFFLAAMAVYAPSARAQSTSETFSLTATVGSVLVSSSFKNVGQSAHQAFVCVNIPETETDGAADIELEGSSDGTNYSAISPLTHLTVSSSGGLGGGTPCGLISGNGYYAAVRLAAYNVTVGSGGTTLYVYGTYQGSGSANPLGGEIRASGDATKVSQIPTTSTYLNSSLKSTGVEIVTAPTSPATSAAFLYGVLVYNPNASTEVYVQLGSNSSPGTSPALIVPVAGGGNVNLTLANPVYSAGNLYIACSTAPTTQVDPTTGCVTELLYINRSGTNARVTAAGSISNTDNGPGAIPHP